MTHHRPQRDAKHRCNFWPVWCWPIAAITPAIVLGVQLTASRSLADSLASTTILALLGLLLVCAITDSLWRRIPNWATFTTCLWAIAISAVVTAFPHSGSAGILFTQNPLISQFPVNIGECLGAAAICFFVMLFIQSMSKGGAGDVKLATAIGALLGIKVGLLAICYTFVLAGVASLSVIVWNLGPSIMVSTFGRSIGSLLLPLYIAPPSGEQYRMLHRPLPLGAFFAAGTLAAVIGMPS